MRLVLLLDILTFCEGILIFDLINLICPFRNTNSTNVALFYTYYHLLLFCYFEVISPLLLLLTKKNGS